MSSTTKQMNNYRQIVASQIARDSYKPSTYGRLYSMRHKAKEPYDNPGYCEICKLSYPSLSRNHAGQHNATREEMIAKKLYKPIEFRKVLDKELERS